MELTDGMDKAALRHVSASCSAKRAHFSERGTSSMKKDTGGASASKGPVVWARSEHAKKLEGRRASVPERCAVAKAKTAAVAVSTKASGIRRSGRISAEIEIR